MSSSFSKVSIVIPALNEEGVVGETVKSIPLTKLSDLGLETEILVIDNASEDNTAQEAEKAGASVIHEPKRGYGSAYLRGLKKAKGNIIVMGDSDGTYPLDKTHEFIQPILNGEADFVIGSRLKGNIHHGAMPWLHRYIGNPLLTFIGNLFFKTNVSDFHCGMRAFTRKALEKMNLQTTGMEFATEMIVEARKKKLQITEIPIEYRSRGGDTHLSSFQDGWRHLKFMLLHAPTYLYLIPGIALLLLGAGIMLTGYFHLDIGGHVPGIHSMIAGSLLFLVGYQVTFLGLFAKIYGINRGLLDSDRITRFVLERLSLEKGATLGSVLFLGGLFYTLYLIWVWMGSGRKSLPVRGEDMVAFTLLVVGLQTIFSSFFLSMIGERK